jgi:hypothetical protein
VTPPNRNQNSAFPHLATCQLGRSIRCDCGNFRDVDAGASSLQIRTGSADRPSGIAASFSFHRAAAADFQTIIAPIAGT